MLAAAPTTAGSAEEPRVLCGTAKDGAATDEKAADASCSADWEPPSSTCTALPPPRDPAARGARDPVQLAALRVARRAEACELAKLLADPALGPREKGRAHCAYMVKWGRTRLQCPSCWMLPGTCVCSELARFKLASVHLAVLMHPSEWGRGSNTGCIAAASLRGSDVLMRGHGPHDERLEQLLADASHTPALLWPGPGALTPDQLAARAAERTGGRVLLVALDGTWAGANRMEDGLTQEGLCRVALPPSLALPQLVEAAHAPSKGPESSSAPPDSRDSAPSSHDYVSGSQTGAAQAAAGAAAAPAAASSDGGATSLDGCQDGGAPAGRSSKVAAAPPGRRSKAQDLGLLGGPVSLFRPLRKYRGNAGTTGRVSTLEAVAGMILALELARHTTGSDAGAGSDAGTGSDGMGGTASAGGDGNTAVGASLAHVPEPGAAVGPHARAPEACRASTPDAAMAAAAASSSGSYAGTAEAGQPVSAMQVYEGLLGNLKLKVDAMRRQKGEPPVYDTAAAMRACAECRSAGVPTRLLGREERHRRQQLAEARWQQHLQQQKQRQHGGRQGQTARTGTGPGGHASGDDGSAEGQ